jgi:hypothetical protein
VSGEASGKAPAFGCKPTATAIRMHSLFGIERLSLMVGLTRRTKGTIGPLVLQWRGVTAYVTNELPGSPES